MVRMSGLNKTDQELLDQLKLKIQQISGLQNHQDLSQKDIDFLIYYIQEKTGDNLSVSTIKRIWRGEFQRLPHISTLNLLSQLAFSQDWLILKKTFLENHKPETEIVSAATAGVPEFHEVKKSYRRGRLAMTILFLLAIGGGLFLHYGRKSAGLSKGDIIFSAKETVDAQVPNTVVFSYDVRGLDAEHFYIQQSWDAAKKLEISKANTKQTDIYYEPGYHYAKLLAGTEILKEIPVYVRYNDWFVRLRYPNSKVIRIENDDLLRSGYLGIRKEYLDNNSEKFRDDASLGYMLSRDFETRADAFEFSSGFRFDSLGAPTCPMVNLLIKGDKEYMWLTLGKKGCESNLGFRYSDSVVSGKTNDLSKFGTDIFKWQKIQVVVREKKVALRLNNEIILESIYTKELGSIKEIDFFFNGVGEIDDVRLADGVGRVRFEDGF